MPRTFRFFQPDIPVTITYRNLPHWEQPDVCYFLTFRTTDSLPAHLLAEHKTQRMLWLEARGIDATSPDWHQHLETLSNAHRIEFHRTFTRRMHAYLDAGHGQCPFRNPAPRKLVEKTLLHFDLVRYILGGFVIMPNHAHVLVQCLGGTRLKGMSNSWKHFSARELNAHAGGRLLAESSALKVGKSRRASVWQGETYDHIVRSREQFEHYQRYLAANPEKAKLREDEYTLFLPEVEFSDDRGVAPS